MADPMIELPTGWSESTFEFVLKSITNGISSKQNKEKNGIPVSRIETIADQSFNFEKIGYVSDYSKVNIKNYKLEKGDILFSHINSSIHLGKTAIFDDDRELYHGTNLLRLVADSNVCSYKFFNFYCKLSRALGFFSLDAQHAVNQSSLNQKKIKSFKLPIPPLPEQKRIVEKLDSLLAQVDTIQQRLNNLPDIIKRFRQSVLAAAVSGKLTEQWRDNSNAKSWQDITFDDLVLESANGLSKRKGSEGTETTILRLADFKDAVRVNGKERKILLTEKEVKKYQLIENDLLVIRVNGSIELAGKFILYNQCSDVEGFCDHFIRFRVNQEKSLPKFLTFITNEGLGRRYLVDSLSTSAGQNTINQTSIKALKIKLPSIAEQTEIVRLVDQYFALADTLEKNLANAKQRVDNLTQSILAKAFRGELVPQDLNDESADKLLARIKAARLEAEMLEKAAKKVAKASKK